jgi:hypothetical protein
MAFSLIGTPVSARSATSPATTPTYDTTGADFLVAIVCHHNAAGGTPAVSDSKSNTWTPLTAYDAGVNGQNVRLYYSIPSSVGSAHTATFSTGGSFAYASVFFTAWSGAAQSSPFDVEAGTTSASMTTLQPGSVSPGQDNSLVITALAFSNVSANITISGSGFSTVEETTSGSPDNGAMRGAWDYVIQTTATAANPTWASDLSIGAATTIAVFKPFVEAPPLSWLPVSFVADGPTQFYVPAGMTPPDKV